MSVRVRTTIILLATLLVESLCLEISNDCGQEQCSSSAVPSVETPKPTQPGYADVVSDDRESSTRAPMPALKRQPTKEELEDEHRRLERHLRADEHPEEPEKHVLERWGFYDTPTFGALDRRRDVEYGKGIGSFEEMIGDDKKLTKRQKREINAELEKFLEDDHKYQVWSAYLYKQETKKRKKRGIPESEIYSYDVMPNPYYQKK